MPVTVVTVVSVVLGVLKLLRGTRSLSVPPFESRISAVMVILDYHGARPQADLVRFSPNSVLKTAGIFPVSHVHCIAFDRISVGKSSEILPTPKPNLVIEDHLLWGALYHFLHPRSEIVLNILQ